MRTIKALYVVLSTMFFTELPSNDKIKSEFYCENFQYMCGTNWQVYFLKLFNRRSILWIYLYALHILTFEKKNFGHQKRTWV